MGLYTDQSGSPYQLVASAQGQAVLAGTNVYPAAAASGQSLTITTGGTYWIMALFDVTDHGPASARRSAAARDREVHLDWLTAAACRRTLSGVLQQTGEPASNYYLLITQ